MRKLVRRSVAVAAAVAVGLTIGVASAQATTHYGKSGTSFAPEDFMTQDGWTQSTDYKTLTCQLHPLLCPTITNVYPADGNPPPGIRTEEFGVLSVAADETGTWEGPHTAANPEFLYCGDSNAVSGATCSAPQDPTSLSFSVDYNEDLGALLDPNIGNDVRYSVFLFEGSQPVATLINDQKVAAVNNWTKVGPIPFDLSTLVPGHSYHFVEITEFKTGVQVGPGLLTPSGVNYDNFDIKSVFNAGKQIFTLAVSTAGPGAVTSSPPGISCGVAGTDCIAKFSSPPAQNVTLTATPVPGATFTGWGGSCAGQASTTCTVKMDQDRSVSASFNGGPTAPATHTLAVSTRGTGSGTVTSSPSGIHCGNDCTHAYPTGTSVTLTENPASGSHFAGWGGACSGSSHTCTVMMSQDRSARATFNAPHGPAFLHWNRLIVNDRCPKFSTHSCLIHLVTFKHDFSGPHPTLNKTVRRRGHHVKRISFRVRPKNNDWARRLARQHGSLHVHETAKAHHHAASRNRKLQVVAFKKP